ncbi:MAG: 2-oxo-4-hydroxy-4-carboxy-5-ureidoimidazoline decarboxylase [Emcibacter sp.]|nr:2-oxo-4-hydroxy-4-carboxy-5-ureidoimidazoline decarboxylase [Emcibacter sp.]
MTDTLEDFMELYGGIYEHSPWIVEAAFIQAPFESVENLHELLKTIVNAADADLKLKLILVHPDLACAPSKTSELTAASQNEQSGAGLNQCSEQEYQDFQDLNHRYRDKFSFPFIVAVKGLHRAEILAKFKERINNDKSQEFETNLNEIHKIAYWRLKALAD